MFSNSPSRCLEFGTVYNVRRHCPPHVSLWWVRVHSCYTEGVCRLCNPPYELGCWGIHEVVGSWTWLCRQQGINVIYTSSMSLICSKHAVVLSAWEWLLCYILAVFWNSLTIEKKQPQPQGAELTSRGRLTGAVARLCVERCRPSRERCLIFVPGRRVCKDNFTSLC